MVGEGDGVRVRGRSAGRVGPVRGVAHDGVERGPGGAEDVGGWVEGGLAEGEVGFLGFGCCGWVGLVSVGCV